MLALSAKVVLGMDHQLFLEDHTLVVAMLLVLDIQELQEEVESRIPVVAVEEKLITNLTMVRVVPASFSSHTQPDKYLKT